MSNNKDILMVVSSPICFKENHKGKPQDRNHRENNKKTHILHSKKMVFAQTDQMQQEVLLSGAAETDNRAQRSQTLHGVAFSQTHGVLYKLHISYSLSFCQSR
jgi:hypothetical protein